MQSMHPTTQSPLLPSELLGGRRDVFPEFNDKITEPISFSVYRCIQVTVLNLLARTSLLVSCVNSEITQLFLVFGFVCFWVILSCAQGRLLDLCLGISPVLRGPYGV